MEHVYNDQIVFDIVYKHLLTQNERSHVPGNSGSCKYRGPNGLKCAIGALIPDELYDPVFDVGSGATVRAVCVGNTDVAKLFSGVSKTLLTDLQRVHDSNPVESWRGNLIDLATRYDLNVPDQP